MKRSSQGSQAQRYWKALSEINYSALSDAGRVRSDNEDVWYADPKLGLLLVLDGMGGEFAGGLASKIVAEVLPILIRRQFAYTQSLGTSEAKKRVLAAMAALSTQLRNKTSSQLGLSGMGATVVAALIRGRHALVAHLGDSRAYLFRHNELEQLTKDHSLAELLVDSGEITAEEARTNPSRNRLTRFVGMPGEPLPEARFIKLNPGDQLMLCTDGLTTMVSNTSLYSFIKSQLFPKETCKLLVDAANKAGGKDNISVLVISI